MTRSAIFFAGMLLSFSGLVTTCVDHDFCVDRSKPTSGPSYGSTIIACALLRILNELRNLDQMAAESQLALLGFGFLVGNIPFSGFDGHAEVVLFRWQGTRHVGADGAIRVM